MTEIIISQPGEDSIAQAETVLIVNPLNLFDINSRRCDIYPQRMYVERALARAQRRIDLDPGIVYDISLAKEKALNGELREMGIDISSS